MCEDIVLKNYPRGYLRKKNVQDDYFITLSPLKVSTPFPLPSNHSQF